MKVIYIEEGLLCVLNPMDECPLSIEEIAAKDVPTGLPYKIVEDTAIPTDHTFRMAWEMDVNLLTDGVGA